MPFSKTVWELNDALISAVKFTNACDSVFILFFENKKPIVRKRFVDIILVIWYDAVILLIFCCCNIPIACLWLRLIDALKNEFNRIL